MTGQSPFLIFDDIYNMNILTISASPYLLVRNGRMNSSVLRGLSSQGHNVATAAWHHDEGFFLPEEGGTHWFEYENKKVCQVFPIEPQVQGSAALYELMKQTQPDLVISIGDYKETDFIWEVKAMYPNLFKWMAVLCVECLYINENHKSALEYADKVISVNEFGLANVTGLANVNAEYVSFGPNHNVFGGPTALTDCPMKVICSAHNAQANNISAFIKSMGQINSMLSLTEDEKTIKGYLHTNLYDPGEYDLDLLIDRYGSFNMNLPEKFVSVKDSITDEEMNDEYLASHVVVDCSVKSATGLTLLEGMASGCIPVGMDIGRSSEIIRQMPKDYQFFVPYETYIGSSEEEYSVISIEGLSQVLLEIKERVFDNAEALKTASDAARSISKKYAEQSFVEKIIELSVQVRNAKDEIAIESF